MDMSGKVSGNAMRRAACAVLCILCGCFFTAFAEETVPVPEDFEEPGIEDDFWASDNYLLVANTMEEPALVEVWALNQETGGSIIWEFLCGDNPRADFFSADAFTVTVDTYDENNILVRAEGPEQMCETCFILDDQDLLTVRDAPAGALEGRVFQRVDDDGLAERGIVSVNEKQKWWLEDTAFESWQKFRSVYLKDNNWFWIYRMPENVYAFFEPYQDQGVISYLIPGEDRALLWDTGMGIADIRKCVEQLTDLPVTVLNSHDHFDHTGGNHLFENVMCYHIDSAVRTLTEGQPHDDLTEYVDPELILNLPDGYPVHDFYRIGKAPTATVEDGEIIDLGGRKLEVMYTPGHSASSIMLIDEENSILFTGDTWYPGPLYAFLEDSSLPDYAASMRRAEKTVRERNIRWIFGSHNEVTVGTELFLETGDFLENVLNGEVDYEMEDGMRVYTMNDVISLQMNPEAMNDSAPDAP